MWGAYSANVINCGVYAHGYALMINHSFTSGGPEGHTGTALHQFNFYYLLAQQPWVDVICEIGFNLGHSAFQWLTGSSSTTKLYSFDLNKHPYAQPMAAFMNKTFPGKFSFIPGDSTITVPAAKHLEGKCDLLIVDGGHTYDIALKDITNMQKLANHKHHLMILDDYPRIDVPKVSMAWLQGQLEGTFQHLYGCTTKSLHKGFSIAVYV